MDWEAMNFLHFASRIRVQIFKFGNMHPLSHIKQTTYTREEDHHHDFRFPPFIFCSIQHTNTTKRGRELTQQSALAASILLGARKAAPLF